MSIKYWWSDDFQWFCIKTGDGVSRTTVSLSREEAAALAMEADPAFADLLTKGRQQALQLLADARDTQARIEADYTGSRIADSPLPTRERGATD